MKNVAIALATENPIIAIKTIKENPLLSLLLVPPMFTMFIFYLSLVFNVNYTLKLLVMPHQKYRLQQ